MREYGSFWQTKCSHSEGYKRNDRNMMKIAWNDWKSEQLNSDAEDSKKQNPFSYADIANMINKISIFTKPKGSLSCSQKPATEPRSLLLWLIFILPAHLRLRLPNVLYPSDQDLEYISFFLTCLRSTSRRLVQSTAAPIFAVAPNYSYCRLFADFQITDR